MRQWNCGLPCPRTNWKDHIDWGRGNIPTLIDMMPDWQDMTPNTEVLQSCAQNGIEHYIKREQIHWSGHLVGGVGVLFRSSFAIDSPNFGLHHRSSALIFNYAVNQFHLPYVSSLSIVRHHSSAIIQSEFATVRHFPYWISRSCWTCRHGNWNYHTRRFWRGIWR